jgi:hypothetical protein
MSEEPEVIPEAVREFFAEHGRRGSRKSWEQTADRSARTAAGRKAAAETYARRRAEKESKAS